MHHVDGHLPIAGPDDIEIIDIGELLKSYVNRNKQPAAQAPVATMPAVQEEAVSSSEGEFIEVGAANTER